MTTSPEPRRGEVWLVEFDPSSGAEIRKPRPAVIISVSEVGRLPLRIVVPMTQWKAYYAELPWFVHLKPGPENGLSIDTAVDCFQVKSVSVKRLTQRLGALTEAEVAEIVGALALCIGFSEPKPKSKSRRRRRRRS